MSDIEKREAAERAALDLGALLAAGLRGIPITPEVKAILLGISAAIPKIVEDDKLDLGDLIRLLSEGARV